MCSEIIYNNVFRNHLQQHVQKSPLQCVQELLLWCVPIIATLVFTYVRFAFCLNFFFCVRCRCRRVFVVVFFFCPTCGGGGIHGYCSIWNFYIKSKLCDVSNQWEEIRWDILGITRLLLIRSLCLHHRGL